MPSRCIAGFCSNTNKDGVSLFKFPKDPELRSKWVKQVRRTREKWEPSAYSVLCSEHFESDCFDFVPTLKESLGCSVQHKRVLLSTAVPTVFPRGVQTCASGGVTTGQSCNLFGHGAGAQAGPVKTTSICASQPNPRSCVVKRNKITVLADAIREYDNTVAAVNDAAKLSCDASCQVNMLNKTRSVSVSAKSKGKEKGTQTCLELFTVSTQTDKEIHKTAGFVPEEQTDEDSDSEGGLSECDTGDLDYEMSDDSDLRMDEESSATSSQNSQHDPPDSQDKHPRIYFVFWSCIIQLLMCWCSCPSCGSRKVVWTRHEVGTLLKLCIRCMDCGHADVWNSQPYFGRVAAGNIRLSAAILFAGATATKVLRVLTHMGTAVISARTFFRHQHHVLHRAVMQLWRERQVWMLSALQSEGRGVVCGGDGRADSPGHSAKYGTYTMMELRKKAVIDIQTVQSNEVGSSYHMEEEGLTRSLELISNFVTVDTIITDRHVSIKKFLRVHHPDIDHLFDIWHVAKGIKKKLQAAAQLKGCEALKGWVASIINHLYWSVVSSPPHDGELVVDKWKSVVYHIQNQHHSFSGRFERCAHPHLEKRELLKAWLLPCTKPAVEMEKIVCNPRLCKDIARLSSSHQTSNIEAFHSLIIHFAPKMTSFSFNGMECRTALAALHFNENAHRAQSVTQEGVPAYGIHFPKYKKGGHIVRKVLEEATYAYVGDLMAIVQSLCEDEILDDVEELETAEQTRLPLSSACERPDKHQAVKDHITRFSTS